MSGYWIFGLGVFLGVCLGFLVAALLGAAHHADHPQDLWQAYQDGFDAGQGRPGCTLAGVADPVIKMRPLSQEQIDTGRAAVKRMGENWAAARGQGK